MESRNYSWVRILRLPCARGKAPPSFCCFCSSRAGACPSLVVAPLLARPAACIPCRLLGRFWYASKIAVQEDHDVAADDSIPENRLISYKKKYWRRVGSIFACFCMIGTQVSAAGFGAILWCQKALGCVFTRFPLQGAVVYGIQKGLASKGGQV
jgi:hypothetical protein